MTDEKQHVDLSKIEPVFRGPDPEDADSRETRQGVDRVGTAAAEVADSTPAVGVFADRRRGAARPGRPGPPAPG